MIQFSTNITGKNIEIKQLEANFQMANEIFNKVCENREHLLPWLEWASSENTSCPEDSYNFLLDAEKGFKDGSKYTYGIFRNNIYIGNIGIFDISNVNKSAEIGYWIAKKETKKGYVREAVKLLENEFFKDGGLNRIQIKCDSKNVSSANVAKNLGYILEGTIRQDSYSNIEQKFRDTVIFSKLKSEHKL